MQMFVDNEGNEIRLTDERISHIRRLHARVLRIEGAIEKTLLEPDFKEPSINDPQGTIYYKQIGQWLVRVVVIFKPEDAFIITAYATREI